VTRASGKALEEVGEVEVVEREAARKALRPAGAELLLPPGRRPEFLPLLETRAELVVRRALLRVLQRLVRFGDFLELLLGARFLRHVRVVLSRELAIRGLDLVLRRVAVDAERRVVVLVFHAAIRWPARPGFASPPGRGIRVIAA
jgi:hypothetical protein